MIASRVIKGQDLSTEVIEFFLDVPFFERINNEEINIIAKHIAVHDVKKDDILFNESDRGNYLGFIVSGRLEVIMRNDAGNEVSIAILTRGHSIGEMAIIEDLPRFATVRALENCKMYILSKSAFDLILGKHPHIGIKLLKGVAYVLSHNLRQTSQRLANLIPD